MRRALSRIPLDTFLVLLVGVVVLAALVPARDAAADVLSVATKAAVALLFALYGARLSPSRPGTECASGSCTRWCWR